MQASKRSNDGTLSVEFESFGHDVLFGSSLTDRIHGTSIVILDKRTGNPERLREAKSIRKRLLCMSRLQELTVAERAQVWEYRKELCDEPELLSRFLESTNWTDRNAVHEAYQFVYLWKDVSNKF